MINGAHDRSKLNRFIDGDSNSHILNLEYKNVIHFIKAINAKDASMALLSIGYRGQAISKNFLNELNTYLMTPKFIDPESFELKLKRMYKRGEITKEEYEQALESRSKQRLFDHILDFDLIYPLFIERYNINLMTNYEINWFEYIMLLENLLEEKSNSLLERFKHRAFKPVKGKGASKYREHNKQGEKLKRIYSI